MLAQRTPAPVETDAPGSSGPYREFLEVANQAHRVANPEQRQAMRVLAATNPTPQAATAGIRQIMGW